MFKKILLLSALILIGCKPQNSNSDIEGSIIPLSEYQKSEELVNELKLQYLIKEDNFGLNSIGLQNGASTTGYELLLVNPNANDNQFQDTGINLSQYNDVALSIWFKTDSINKVQMIFWQGVNGQNGWGGGSNSNLNSEFNIALNHWNDMNGEVLSAFFGYNETAVSADLSPLGFPVRQNLSNSQFELSGNKVVIDNQWHHLIVNYKHLGNSIEIETFIDGALINSGVGSQSDTSQWNENLRIGSPGTNVRSFNGKLKLFKAFNKTLTLKEIQSIRMMELL